ncbi:nephrin isoform X1 [Contarinia nasturtii]|uniref:nephrin isoform X1 n=1 Tax=Contarinia nasturtii TaxID=265458 RepID=UPI0012D4B558|nr:nephrin isoform X1 [Contarinia nasturtii]XP_031640307.1 nephrin isoform X1 [Contarinia nasturtii]XP_031640308.1 nephrin isoform X1 [Contarinia nasturtii]XP_031640309.1 nephrin isoform X1 [Contarinia nasturtii]
MMSQQRSLEKLLYIILTAMIVVQTSAAQQQKFKVTPHDLQVLEGSEAVLRCEVSNLAGQVQWTKDGFALGFSAVIPGFPRYSVLGDRSQGVYNLRISNASLEDDAEYQCQVGPAKFNSAIRANAKLTVISPPSNTEIQGYGHNSKVEVRENQDLTLTCIVSDAKPAAQIQWYRNNVEIKTDRRDDKVIESNKRFTTTSRLQLSPTPDEDYVEYSCQAKHKALQPDMPMRATVQLSVLYPPGAPYIEGYTTGETLRRGQNVELVCKSRGGNPPAQLIWYKNGVQVRMAYRTSGRISENIYSFTAEANDNKARFRCEASNIMSQTPLKAEVDLTVMFAPTHVTITGATEARVGDVVPLQCATAPSNPPAEIKWMVAGKQIRNATSKTVVSPEGGWVTTSNITALVEPNKRSLVVICHGLNMQLTENVVSTHTVNVLYPPSSPIISGYVEGSIIPAGSIQKLVCISSGGNPLATLQWYKNDKKINSALKTNDKSVSAEINILANVTDNQAIYKCEAHNSATEIPLFETKTLSVHFAPETVKIRVEPAELVPGVEATLICDSSSSNPPAKLSWWKDGIPVPVEGINNASKAGLWGGTVSSLELKINVTQEMNGIVYTCQSNNEALQRSVHEAQALQVLYPPVFVPPPSAKVVGIEGESLQAAVQAHANPMSITYTWMKDGLPIINNGERIVSDGPVLNITKLTRSDTGNYTAKASNSQGSATVNIYVFVEYGTTIKAVSENVIGKPGDDATLSCTVEGQPLSAEHVRWERLGYDMSEKTKVTFVNGTSYLTIKDAQREDVGNFRCIADNRVANPTSRDVLLIVKFAPEIDKTILRAASGENERGRLPCRAQAAPMAKFVWTYNGQNLNVNKTWKYNVELKQIDPLTYESTLLIEKVGKNDYGNYECMARNELGVSKENVRLEVTSKPDTPQSLNILNTTHDSVTVAWTPGFDGGMKASYRIRYREMNSEHYKYEDGLPNSLKLTITGLKMNTVYLFSVMASNHLGNSNYLPDLTRAQTKDAPPTGQPASSLGGPPTTSATPTHAISGTLLIVGIACGTLLVLINILIIGCCLHKRNTKQIKREASNQNSKSATIEMYAPSSYNDTVTGETLSSVSEKSDSYSNEGSQPDYMDETRKKAASTYLVENSDIPPPRYQDGTLPMNYPNNTANSVNTRTLPHPRHNSHVIDPRARDDQMLGKGYMPSPSPALPLDGSYYNMNSDRYLSYPPMDYPNVEFSTPPLQMTHIMPINGTIMNAGGGTLRRGAGGMRAMVPPPDVTHHTTNHSKSTHDLNNSINQNVSQQTLNNHSNKSSQLSSNNSSMTTSTKQPPGILKDPNRKQQQQQQQQQQMLAHPNMQILNVQNAPGIGNSLLMTSTGSTIGVGTYEPNPHNLSSFNASMGYTDADGHLV